MLTAASRLLSQRASSLSSRTSLLLLCATASAAAMSSSSSSSSAACVPPAGSSSCSSTSAVPTEAELRARLPANVYAITRGKGTERAFTSPLLDIHAEGSFSCVCCGETLYQSSTKFDSGSGWPSFWAAEQGSVAEHADNSHGMRRVEITCKKCGSHLGHVFTDGPKPTGMRHCVNGASLVFVPKGQSKQESS